MYFMIVKGGIHSHDCSGKNNNKLIKDSNMLSKKKS